MMYEFVWTHKNERHTERALPLVWHGQHLRRMGWANPIVLVFLEGLDLLSREYRRDLESLGYQILDGSALARRLLRDVHPLLRGFPATEKLWLLRWTVFGNLVRGSSEDTAILIDSDLVFMADPRDLANLTGPRLVANEQDSN